MTDHWPDSNVAALRALAGRLQIDPRDLVAVMANESGCLPDPPHNSKARGLIQFEPETLHGLGWPADPDAFARQGVAEQLEYVERYYRPYARAGYLRHGLGAIYTATFLPALLAHAGDQTFVLCAALGPFSWAYRDNGGFDPPVGSPPKRKGYITVGDMAEAARKALARSTLAQSIIAKIDAQEAEPIDEDDAPAVCFEPLNIPGADEATEPEDETG